MRPRTPRHASLRRRRRRAVHRRLRVPVAPRPTPGSLRSRWGSRRTGSTRGRSTASGAVDAEGACVVPAGEEAPRRRRSTARRGGHSEFADARCSDNASSASAPSAGTWRCSSSGCGGTGSPGGSGRSFHAASASHCGGINGAAGSLPTGSRARRRTGRWPGTAAARARGAAWGKLLLDRRSLPRQPLAARSTKPSAADEHHRPGPAPRASARRAAERSRRHGSTGRSRRGARRDRPLVPRLRRRPTAGPRSRVDGVGVPAGRRFERGRDRGDAASARDLGVRGHGAPRGPHAAELAGNVRAGVRYLRWQLDEFGGNRRLALAGWYQGARAVREIGLYDDTKLFVRVVLPLYGTV